MKSFNPMDAFNLLQGTNSPLNTGSVGAGMGMINQAQLAQAAPQNDWWSPTSIFGGRTADGTQINGWGSTALGMGQAGLGAYFGMQQYGLAKDQLAESKRQFNKNYENQRSLTNSRLEDRQRARHAANPNAYVSPSDYMKKHGV